MYKKEHVERLSVRFSKEMQIVKSCSAECVSPLASVSALYAADDTLKLTILLSLRFVWTVSAQQVPET